MAQDQHGSWAIAALGANLQNPTKERQIMKKKGKGKVEKTMHEFKHGELHSGSKSGPKVKSRKQAIAIALSQQRKAGKKRGKMSVGEALSR